LRRRLWIFCAIAAVLSAISFIDGILVVATFFAVIPALILGFAPEALMVGVAFLMADMLTRQRPGARKGAIALTIGGWLLALGVAAAWFNRPLGQEIQGVTKEDHDLSETPTGARNIAIQFVTNERPRAKLNPATPGPTEMRERDEDATTNVVPPPRRKQFCERLCLYLLFNGIADSVIVSTVPAAEDVLKPDPDEIGMRFHLGRRGGCRDPDIKTDDVVAPPYRLFERAAEVGFAEEIAARMIKDGCVLGEPARLADAQIIVQENAEVLPSSDVPSRPSSARNIRHVIFAPARAARLSIYQVEDRSVTEVFRQTEVEAFPLLPVLLLGPVITGEGGIGISEGFLRWHRIYSGYTLREILKSKLGLNVVRISR
jgi:hypothetical protein